VIDALAFTDSTTVVGFGLDIRCSLYMILVLTSGSFPLTNWRTADWEAKLAFRALPEEFQTLCGNADFTGVADLVVGLLRLCGGGISLGHRTRKWSTVSLVCPHAH